MFVSRPWARRNLSAVVWLDWRTCATSRELAPASCASRARRSTSGETACVILMRPGFLSATRCATRILLIRSFRCPYFAARPVI